MQSLITHKQVEKKFRVWINDLSKQNISSFLLVGNGRLWIGLQYNDKILESYSWRWVNNSTLNHTSDRWGTGEPDRVSGSANMCAFVAEVGGGGLMRDKHCQAESISYVCEHNL